MVIISKEKESYGLIAQDPDVSRSNYLNYSMNSLMENYISPPSMNCQSRNSSLLNLASQFNSLLGGFQKSNLTGHWDVNVSPQSGQNLH